MANELSPKQTNQRVDESPLDHASFIPSPTNKNMNQVKGGQVGAKNNHLKEIR